MCNVTKFIAYFKVSISDIKGLKGRESGLCVSPASWGQFSPILRHGFLKLNSYLVAAESKILKHSSAQEIRQNSELCRCLK